MPERHGQHQDPEHDEGDQPSRGIGGNRGLGRTALLARQYAHHQDQDAVRDDRPDIPAHALHARKSGHVPVAQGGHVHAVRHQILCRARPGPRPSAIPRRGDEGRQLERGGEGEEDAA